MYLVEDDMLTLIEKLNKATEAYDVGKPIMTDSQWDDLYFRLEALEKETGITYSNSPTQTIHFETKEKLEKVPLDPPMLSLDKTKATSDIDDFCNHKSWCAMFKMDGISCRLIYQDGKLFKAVTRGNGEVGEDITHNVRRMQGVPLTVPTTVTLYIDGEIVCNTEIFESKFKTGTEQYKNPRNFVAGVSRRLSNQENAVEYLTFIAWNFTKGFEAENQFNYRLEKLDELGFTIVPVVFDAETPDDACKILDNKTERKYYPIDGYVFRYTDEEYYQSLGRTAHHFRGAYAYKFYDEEYETRLRKVRWQMGRTGVLTPVADFDPVEIDGTTVTRASLHNLSVLKDTLNTPYFEQKIWVTKKNMVIPAITKAEKGKVGRVMLLEPPTECPICGSSLEIKTSTSGVKDLYCPNKQCMGKLVQRINHFCSKKGLDIKGLSEKRINDLIDFGFITDNLLELYDLPSYREEWIKKPGYGEKSIEKILDAIQDSQENVSLPAFISALGIPLVGVNTAKLIANNVKTWENFLDNIDGDWTIIDGIGEEISDSINNYDYTEAKMLAQLMNFIEPTDDKSSVLNNLTFCITGKLHHYKNRVELQESIENRGGKVVSSVSKKTDFLLTNDTTQTTKYKRAVDLGIPILSEEDFIAKFGK